MLPELGKTLLIMGIMLAVIGVVLMISGKFPFFENLGKLPGDIRIEKKTFSFYFPITTCIIISIIISLILRFFFKK